MKQPPFLRCIEALTRAGQYDRQLLPKAVSMFEVCTWNSCAMVKKLMKKKNNPIFLGLFTLSQSCRTLY